MLRRRCSDGVQDNKIVPARVNFKDSVNIPRGRNPELASVKRYTLCAAVPGNRIERPSFQFVQLSIKLNERNGCPVEQIEIASLDVIPPPLALSNAAMSHEEKKKMDKAMPRMTAQSPARYFVLFIMDLTY